MSDSATTATPAPTAKPASPKFWPAFLLCLFLGCFGAHRFYLKSPKRVLMLGTLGVCGVWALVDCVTILLGKFKDETGAVIPNPKPAVSWTIFAICVIIGLANGHGGGMDGTYNVSYNAEAAMQYEKLTMSGNTFAYVGMIDKDNAVMHRGSLRFVEARDAYADKETQGDSGITIKNGKRKYVSDDAVITLKTGESEHSFRATIELEYAPERGHGAFREPAEIYYFYKNLESGRSGETKYFEKP